MIGRRYVSFLAVISLLGIGLSSTYRSAPPPRSIQHATHRSSETQSTIPKIDIESITRPHLARAAKRSLNSIDEQILELREFFIESRTRTRQYAKAALGFKSKWRLIGDNLPFSEGGSHQKYLRDEFEKTVFSIKDLEHAIRQSIQTYLMDVNSAEGLMLVDLRSDLDGLGSFDALVTQNGELLARLFRDSVERVRQDAALDLQSNVGTQVVSLIAGELLTQIAVRLGVSAGILGTGTASGWVTFGAGIIVGIIADQVVTVVWDWWADPVGELKSTIDEQLRKFETLLIEGDEQVVGLERRLHELAQSRAQSRETAVNKVLRESLNPVGSNDAKRGRQSK